jgi:hypothetical protein
MHASLNDCLGFVLTEYERLTGQDYWEQMRAADRREQQQRHIQIPLVSGHM